MMPGRVLIPCSHGSQVCQPQVQVCYSQALTSPFSRHLFRYPRGNSTWSTILIGDDMKVHVGGSVAVRWNKKLSCICLVCDMAELCCCHSKTGATLTDESHSCQSQMFDSLVNETAKVYCDMSASEGLLTRTTVKERDGTEMLDSVAPIWTVNFGAAADGSLSVWSSDPRLEKPQVEPCVLTPKNWQKQSKKTAPTSCPGFLRSSDQSPSRDRPHLTAKIQSCLRLFGGGVAGVTVGQPGTLLGSSSSADSSKWSSMSPRCSPVSATKRSTSRGGMPDDVAWLSSG